MRRVVAVLVVPLLLATAACGGSDSTTGDKPTEGTVADVGVSGNPGEEPTLDFTAPMSFAETGSAIVTKGPGTGQAVAKAGSVVSMHYVLVNASDSVTIDDNYDEAKPAPFALDSVFAGMTKGLTGDHAGDRVVIAVASADFNPNGNGTTIRAGDSLIMVVDLLSVSNPLKEATGTKVTPPASVPTLSYDKLGHPEKFTATDTTPDKVGKLGVFPLVKGDGVTVQKGQTIAVEYVGQLYPDGKVFDESWSNDQSISFQIGTQSVIAGWDQGLVGQRVGSRVILTIPSDLGYGATGQGEAIPPDSDLIFVVDILQAY